MTRSIVDRLQDELLVCEGAMGSELAAQGVAFRNTGEANLTAPEVVAAVHRSYQDAGAQVFQTNTFAANLLMLERAGLAEQAAALQTAAVRNAREGLGPEPLLALGVGPTGHLLEPLGDTPGARVVACYRQQFETMLPQAVDFVLLETFEALDEVEAALQALREIDAEIPVAVTMSFSGPRGMTMMGQGGAQVAQALAGWGVDVIGANCGEIEGLRVALREMAEATDLPLMAQPNAGMPELIGGQTVYRQTPEDFGRFGQELVEAGVRLLGGCCGTTPEHIRQLARVVRAEA
ncbi:MAG TPA: homocysteine S-methyltransferase family protein [Armatimonadota bacterium]|jgi:methionine synthase I (cobalamin-dependent)